MSQQQKSLITRVNIPLNASKKAFIKVLNEQREEGGVERSRGRRRKKRGDGKREEDGKRRGVGRWQRLCLAEKGRKGESLCRVGK